MKNETVVTLSFTLPEEQTAYDIAAHAMEYACAWRALKNNVVVQTKRWRHDMDATSCMREVQGIIDSIEQEFILPRPE